MFPLEMETTYSTLLSIRIILLSKNVYNTYELF